MNPKHKVTQSLVKQSIHLDESLENIYELIYKTHASDRSILSDAIKKYDVDINILHAHVLDVVDMSIGFLYVHILGNDMHQAITYIQSKGIQVSKYDRI